MTYELTREQLNMLRELRSNGCAVVILLPDELGTASRIKVQDAMILAGFEAIESLTNLDTLFGGE